MASKKVAWLKFDMDRLTVQLAVMHVREGHVLVDNQSLAAMFEGGSYVPDPEAGGWTITEQLADELLQSNGFRRWDERDEE